MNQMKSGKLRSKTCCAVHCCKSTAKGTHLVFSFTQMSFREHTSLTAGFWKIDKVHIKLYFELTSGGVKIRQYCRSFLELTYLELPPCIAGTGQGTTGDTKVQQPNQRETHTRDLWLEKSFSHTL